MDSTLKELLNPNCSSSEWLQQARIVLKDLKASPLPDKSNLLREVILFKLDVDESEILDALLSFALVVSVKEGFNPCPSSLESENDMDLKRKLIKINLYLSNINELSALFVAFVSSETNFSRIKLVVKGLWPLLQQDFINILSQVTENKLIYILFNIWKKIDDPSLLYTSEWYWSSICEGLCQSLDSGTVKRALYLLRVSNKETLRIKSPSMWNEYFDLIETLDEKQVHIVRPSLSKLLLFQSAFSEDRRWYFVIYRRLFKHQNLALVDWTLNRFLRTYSFEDTGLQFFKRDLLPALNISKLYQGDRTTRESAVVYFEKCNMSVFDDVLREICEMNHWAPIPLFFTVHSLRKVTDKFSGLYALSNDVLKHISEFCRDGMTCMYAEIQRSIKYHFLNIILGSKCQFPDVFSAVRGILKPFLKMQIITPSSAMLMRSIKAWLSDLPLGTLLDDSNEWERVLFAQLQEDPEYHIQLNVLSPLLETINRPYAPVTNDFETYVLYVNHFSKKLLDSQYVGDFMILLRRRLDKIKCPMGLSNDLHNCINAFEMSLSTASQEEFIVTIYKDYHESSDSIKKFILLAIIASFPKCVPGISHNLTQWMSSRFPDALLTNKVSLESGRLMGGLECVYLKNQWIILSRYSVEVKVDIFDAALNSLDIGGKEVSLPIAQYFTHLVSYYKDIHDLAKQINDTILTPLKEAIFYYQKNSAFKSLLEAFIKLCLHPEMIRALPSETSHHASCLLNESEAVSVIAETLSGLLIEYSMPMPVEWSGFILEMLIYGPIFRKDLALSEEVCKMALHSIHEEFLDYPSIRSVGYTLAFQLVEKVALVDILWSHVLGGDIESRKRRHFDNSLTHLRRNRAAQGILILMDELSFDHESSLFHSMIDEILNEDKSRQQQPSVRYLMEWTLSRLLVLHPSRSDFYDRLFSAYEIAKSTRLTVIPSFLIIFTQIALHVPIRRESILELICPWLMGQHFANRICAQIGFRRIQRGSDKWRPIESYLNDVLKQGNEEKNMEKMQMDFYQNSFDAINNWNLRDILKEFPRLCGILRQDWLKDCDLESLKVGICPKNPSSCWSYHRGTQPCYCPECLPDVEKSKLDISLSQKDMNEDLQKKIVVPLQEESDEGEGDMEKAYPNIILVASLIDRLPNLGGLCRTSEIFGIGSLVLNCRKSLEEKEFQNLSVSSQSWVNVTEVRREVLPAWLRSMKEEKGFNLLGVEQTAQSCDLYQFNFPEKSILVLGNEKEGICPEVLRELDTTLEIPQYGMIRSFNVHVTGALVLSEYVRQWRKK